MNNIQDLNIEKEILSLFDYSLNMFTKRKILEILKTPLSSKAEIVQRQKIFSGFTANDKILEDYSYTVFYLTQVHFFLNDEKIKDLSQKKLKYKLFTSKREKTRYASKFNQLILFFHRLQSKYFLRLNLDHFPEEYRLNIKRILEFLSSFNLHEYEKLVREDKLKDKNIIDLTRKIFELKKQNRIIIFWEDLFLFEAYLSINYGIHRNNFIFPKFIDKGIKLQEFYHPLIKKPVKNDFETVNNVIILNGPNMSGKSTFLKAVGICVYFGHLGLGVPASYGEIPFCNHFSIKINRRDDILNGYSHFMTEVLNLKEVVQQASNAKKCFAIFDELFSGTNVEDAYDICKTTIKGLSKFEKSYFFISTHIQELEHISHQRSSNYYLDCDIVNNKPTFTYKLKKGWSHIKVGRILFEKEGLNKMLD